MLTCSMENCNISQEMKFCSGWKWDRNT